MHPFEWKRNPVLDYNQPADLREPRRADPIRPGITNNPRDNLVTLIAVTAGEEGYTDLNNNGKWDDGEPFDDQTEPFVDNNDNGTWDPDERWVDTNGNGVWDGKNNKFDASTLIWVQDRILWTGMPGDRDFRDIVAPIYRQITPPPIVPHFGSAPVSFIMSDPWFNSPAQNGGSDGCSVYNGDSKKLVEPDSSSFGPQGIVFTYPSFTIGSVNLVDVHDPEKSDPPDYPWDSPLRNPNFPGGLGFVVGVSCQYTATPEQGYITRLVIPAISGIVF
jgi:hypothetical protein